MKRLQKDLFFSILGIIFFFLTSNAYAQGAIDYSDTYDGTVEFFNTGHGLEDPYEYNSSRSQAVNAHTTASNLLLFMAPETSSSYAAILESDTISPGMKRGVYGMATDSVNAMFQAQPQVNVYAHLAEEWIPGHQATTSIYAQSNPDSGYDELMATGINQVWRSVLNITYVFFIVIMIVVGFMIMFRSKLGGQTLVTLGNTLPHIILALIGATFSFAIAGLIIDLGGVIMVVLVNIFEGVAGNAYAGKISIDSFGSLFSAVVPHAFFSELMEGVGSITDAFGSGLGSLGIKDYIALARLPQKLGQVGLVSILMLLIAITIGTVGVIKVFLTLIKAYLTILVNVVTAPIQIAMSAIPGKSVNLINWAKNIFRAVLVYPITFAILNLPGVIYAITDDQGLKLPGPDKLTLSDGSPTFIQSVTNFASSTGDLFNEKGINNAMLIFILQIFILFIASKADAYAKTIVPPTTSKQGAAAAEEAKRALSGIPFVGSLIK